jgi:hypothetical protein
MAGGMQQLGREMSRRDETASGGSYLAPNRTDLERGE